MITTTITTTTTTTTTDTTIRSKVSISSSEGMMCVSDYLGMSTWNNNSVVFQKDMQSELLYVYSVKR